MRYFFDIHYKDEVFPDGFGEEFRTPDEAKQFVLETAAEFLATGRKPNAKVFAQAIIEITDRHGYSDILVVADLFDGRVVPRDTHFRESAPHISPGP